MDKRFPPFSANKSEALLVLWVLAAFALYLWQFRGFVPHILALVLPA